MTNPHNFYELSGLGAAVVFNDFRSEMASQKPVPKAAPKTKADDVAKPVSVAEPQEMSTFSNLTPWGTDNLFPEKARDLIKKNSKLKVGLSMSATDLLAMGVQCGIIVEDEEKGEEYFKAKTNPEFKEWDRRADLMGSYAILAAKNLKAHYVAFVSVVLSADRKKIALLKTIPAWQCRLDKADESGYHRFCYVSSAWKDNPSLDDKTKVKKLPLVDTWYDPALLLRNQVDAGTATEFILYLRIPTDEIDYSLPDWYSIVEQQWLDVSNDVPAFKKWVMKNLTTLNQILYIHEDYYRMQYPEWDKWKKDAAKGDEEAIKKVKAAYESVVKIIEDKLQGLKNSGRMITAPLLAEKVGDLAKSIIIEKIDQQTFDGKYNADANEADSQILFALKVDPNQNGAQPGSSGEFGSAKRQSHNLSQVNQFIFEHVLLAPYRLVRDFNGFPADMEFRIRRATVATLSNVTASKREAQPEA